MFAGVYKNKKVLVTGNTGFKGAWLSVWLRKLGADVYGASRNIISEPDLFTVIGLDKDKKHKWLDIRDAKATQDLIGEIQPDFIFHLAAQAIVSESYLDPLGTVETNVTGTANILEAVRKLQKPCSLVLVSSDKCYENHEWHRGYTESDCLGGKDVYSASKGAMEIIIHSWYHSFFRSENSPVRMVSARAGNVIGGGDWAANRLIPDCFRSWIQNKPVEIRNPQSTRPWQHVLDPLSGYLSLGAAVHTDRKFNGEAFNFGPTLGQDFTVLEMIKVLSGESKVGSINQKYIIDDKSNKFHEANLLKLDCTKAAERLGWHSTLDFQVAAAYTAEWYNEYYSNNKEMFDYTSRQIDQYVEMAKTLNREWLQ